MRKLVFCLLAVLFAGPAFATDTPWNKKLPFKSAAIAYKVTGTMKGSKTIYVKDYGQTTAEYSDTSMSMMGITQAQKEIIITTPDWVYTADLVEHTGSKQANMRKFLLDAYNRLSSGDKKKAVKNADAQGMAAVQGLNGRVEKNAEKILGYSCDKVTAMGITAYNISGCELPLKIVGNTMGIKVSEEATEVSTGSVPASKFKLPEGIVFEHDASADQMMKEQAHTIMTNFVAGRPVMSGVQGNGMGAIQGNWQADDDGSRSGAGQMDQMPEEMQNLLKNFMNNQNNQ